MNMLQKAGAFIFLLIGVLVCIFTFMYAFDIYPSECSTIIIEPLHSKCIDFNNVDKYDFSKAGSGGNYKIDFYVKVPEYTLKEDKIFLETKIESYEMENLGDGMWHVAVVGRGPMDFRYNRNNLGFLSAEQFAEDSKDKLRSISFSNENRKENDVVESWRYLSGRKLNNVAVEDIEVKERSSFEKGFSMAEYWDDGFLNLTDNTFEKIVEDNADSVILAIQNPYLNVEPLPEIKSIDEDYSSSIKQEIASAKKAGLKVILKLKLCCNNPPNTKYSNEWWGAWFDEVEKVVVENSKFAEENGIESIIIDYTFGTSMPGEYYAPRFSEERWDEIIKKIRENYSGRIGFNTFISKEYNKVLSFSPDGVRRFSTDVDFYGVELWTGISDNGVETQEVLDENADSVISKIVTAVSGLRKPVIISGLAYSSADKTSMGEKGVSGNTNGLSALEERNNELVFDGKEQAMVYEAYLKAIARHPEILGIYSYGYSFIELPDSFSYSIRGKEAENVVKEWFGRF